MHSQKVLRRALKALLTGFFVVTSVALGAPAQASTLHHVHTHHAHPSNIRPQPTGYWVVNRSGGVGAAGGAPSWGGLAPSVKLDDAVVGMAPTPAGLGYWLATAGGKVFRFGDAQLYGRPSPRQLHYDGAVVALAATADGHGYWLLSAKGRVFNFGDAHSYGSVTAPQFIAANGSLSSLVATPEGGGYWVVGSGGQVYCFGDAVCYQRALAVEPEVVGLAPTPDGKGYWLATTTGQVLGYGDASPALAGAVTGAAVAKAGGAAGQARAAMSLQRSRLGGPYVGIAASLTGHGYWLADAEGSTFGFGAAAGKVSDLARKTVAIVPDPTTVFPGKALPAGPGAVLSPSSAVTVSTLGDAAVKFALSQVGKPYIYGATGPYGYDCSGLALASWLRAGVNLPRTAAEQYYAGGHVPLSQLQPGDLVFWASDPSDPSTIYHVAISLGGDETVQATHTGSTVMVMSMWGQDLVPMATVP